jgi:uncharacterized protein involved in outer membrane biogenesis
MPPLPAVFRRPWLWVVLVMLVGGYAAAGFWLVPRLVASNVREVVASRYHRQVKLGLVTFNPFTLELVVNDFALPDADGGPLLSFARLAVRLGRASLFRLAPEFNVIALDAPRVRIVHRANGQLNILDLVPPPDPKADKNAPPPRLWIDEFAIRGGEATFVDLKRERSLTLAFRPISFTLKNFSTRSEGNAYALSARSARGEGFEWRGTFGLSPLASQGTFAVSGVRAATLADVGSDQIPFEMSTGELDLNGSYEVAEHGAQLAVGARIAELVVRTLGIRARGDATDAVQIPRLAVSDTNIDLVGQRLTVGHVSLEQPHVTALRGRDGQISLMRLLPPAQPGAAVAPAPPADPGAAPVKPWTIEVPEIRIIAADLSLEDHTPPGVATIHLAPVDLVVSNFAAPGNKPLGIDLKAVVNETGQLTATGSLTPAPLTGRLQVTAAALPLASLQPYLDAQTAMVIGTGTAKLAGTVTLADGGSVQFDGSAGVDDLKTTDALLQQDFVDWRALQLSGVRVRTAPLGVSVSEVLVHEPYARVVIGANGIVNLKEVLNPRAAAAQALVQAQTAAAAPSSGHAAPVEPPPPPPPPGAPLPVQIGTIRIDHGSVNFADLSIKPNFATGIGQLAGTLKGLSARADSRADIDLAGAVDQYSPVKITGNFNFFSAVHHLDLKATFRNMELTSLSPYSGRFAGYAIEKGKLSADLNYRIENRQLNAAHKLTIQQLQLGEKIESAEATHLPVKLAIALLKDRNGVIDLDLPVSGSLDDPEFSVGPIIWKVIVGLIEKAVTAPFALLGSLFGGGEEISYVDFAAGSAALDVATTGKLQTLVKALDSRPALNVDVPLIVQPDSDRTALIEARWHDTVTARARARLGSHANDGGAVDRLLATPKDYQALLEDAYREGFGHRAEIPKAAATETGDPATLAIGWLEGQLKGRISIGQDELDALAQARAAAVQGALLGNTGIDPARVFVIAFPPLPAPPVRMQLALH